MESRTNDSLEARIIETAKEMFVENGYACTSMSDIAQRVGINRPALHYYFRTKERMFQAVFGGIVNVLVPRVQNIVLRQDLPTNERIGKVVDAYFDVFTANPHLPLFIMREMQRDFDNVVQTIVRLHIAQYFVAIKRGLQAEMDSGRLAKVPMRFLFMSFYSMVTMPFIAKNLCQAMLLYEGESFDDLLAQWKPYIVGSIERLLCVENGARSQARLGEANKLMAPQ